MNVLVAVFVLPICYISCIFVNHMCETTLSQMLLLEIWFFLSCNSMPLGACRAYYGNVHTFFSVA